MPPYAQDVKDIITQYENKKAAVSTMRAQMQTAMMDATMENGVINPSRLATDADVRRAAVDAVNKIARPDSKYSPVKGAFVANAFDNMSACNQAEFLGMYHHDEITNDLAGFLEQPGAAGRFKKKADDAAYLYEVKDRQKGLNAQVTTAVVDYVRANAMRMRNEAYLSVGIHDPAQMPSEAEWTKDDNIKAMVDEILQKGALSIDFLTSRR